MARPKELKIGGFTWEIRWLKHDKWAAEDKDLGGFTQSMKSLIVVRLSDENGDYAKAVIKETLLHEILHACYHITGMNHTAVAPEADNQEEHTIQHITPALLAVLRDNPEVSRYLLT